MKTITVISGSYRGAPITDTEFPLLAGPKMGAKGEFATVDASEALGAENSKIRVQLVDYTVNGETAAALVKKTETDEQVIERIAERFEILDIMTQGTIDGDIRAMIVVGPPGVGKSYGVIKKLQESPAAIKAHLTNQPVPFQVIKGAMTALGLYVSLYEHQREGNVLIFDDCDTILQDELSLNLLKAALDTSKVRRIYWNADSHKLGNQGIPSSFEFKGSIIFITNIKFDTIRSAKLRDHLGALMSRCHYLDLTMDTMRDRFLRIRQIADTGELFARHKQAARDRQEEILTFIYENRDRLNEMSLRMAVKIGDLVVMNPEKWQALAENTCMKRS